MANIKFAIVGLGFVGKRHAAMIAAHPEAELVALCDALDKTELSLGAFEELPFFQSLSQLLESSLAFDVLCVCTPNGLHAEQAIAALQAEKHVVIEKPMALKKADCERVIYKALNVSRQVFVVMQNRYSPPSVWLKTLLQQGYLGAIYMVQINCYWNRDERYYFPQGKKHPWKGSKELDGGTLFTQFSHFIDILYWLFGDITDIKASFANFAHAESIDFEDTGSVSFKLVNGGMGCINYSTALPRNNLESSITIIGERGTVKVGGQYMNEVLHCDVEDYTMPELPAVQPPNDYGTYKGSAANHHFVIANVVDVLKGRKQITTNALEGLKVVEMIEKIYDSSKR